MNTFVIITAGGLGLRMNNLKPKQFLEIGGKPILMHTINAFYTYSNDINIIVTLPESSFNEWNSLVKKHNFNIQHLLVIGGETRFYSIKNALEYVDTPSLVAIHDGVRPFVSKDLIEKAFQTALKSKSAIPILPMKESIRKMFNESLISVDRNLFYSIQTPQVFDSEQIIKAYQRKYSPEFTDDGSVYEKEFGKIQRYDGISENIKITTPIDLVIANALFVELSGNPAFPHLL